MVVSRTFGKYGRMTAFDLVVLSHGDGGAWKATYVPGRDAEITPEAILSSSDGRVTPEFSGTLASGMQEVDRRISNTFRLLRNALPMVSAGCIPPLSIEDEMTAEAMAQTVIDARAQEMATTGKG